jgi:hypothetical protein
VAYHVEIRPAVVDYIATVALSATDQKAVLQGVIAELSQDADYFLARYPLAHESLHFRYDYIHPTYETLFTFEFIVDASAHEMGVICVTFVECTAEPMQ